MHGTTGNTPGRAFSDSGKRHQPVRLFPDDLEIGLLTELGSELRASAWDLAKECVDQTNIQGPTEIERLGNLPAFIGAFATSLMRPAPGRRFGRNPMLVRLAASHVEARRASGHDVRQVVQEFLALRRILWSFITTRDFSTPNGKTMLWLEEILSTILDEVITEGVVSFIDNATHELTEISSRDSLTGLLNHKAFHDRLAVELARSRRYGHELQVIFLDLDNFKQVNDLHGHPSGDRVLSFISGIVTDSIRESDFAGRVGGDEFVICLVESTELAAHLLVDRLREQLASAAARGEVPAGAGLSAGCATWPIEAADADQLLALADRRLYEDKHVRKIARQTESD